MRSRNSELREDGFWTSIRRALINRRPEDLLRPEALRGFGPSAGFGGTLEIVGKFTSLSFLYLCFTFLLWKPAARSSGYRLVEMVKAVLRGHSQAPRYRRSHWVWLHRSGHTAEA